MLPVTATLIHVYSSLHLHGGMADIENYLRSIGVDVHMMPLRSYPKFLSRTLRGKSNKFDGIAKSWMRKEVLKVDHVFLWNGESIYTETIRWACWKEEVPCSIVEVGYFPQKHFFVLDSQGINATSSLMHDSLDWVETKHHNKVKSIRESHLRGRQWKGGGGYILIPLQLASDTNIVNNSDFSTMTEFVRHCEATFPNKKLRFKRHPLDTENYNSAHPIHTDGDFLDLAVDADLVYGINSTCLLESLLLGAPTESIGKGFIAAHKHQPDKLLAALVDKQIPVGEKNISYWLKKYCAK